jgi:hypothetical protein
MQIGPRATYVAESVAEVITGVKEGFGIGLGTSQFGQSDQWKFTYVVASKSTTTPKSPVDKIGGLTGEPD